MRHRASCLLEPTAACCSARWWFWSQIGFKRHSTRYACILPQRPTAPRRQSVPGSIRSAAHTTSRIKVKCTPSHCATTASCTRDSTPARPSGPRCFQSTTRATINNLSKFASNLPPPSDKTPPYAADSFRAITHLSEVTEYSHRSVCCLPRLTTPPRILTVLLCSASTAAHLHLYLRSRPHCRRRTGPRYPQTTLITRRASPLHNGCSSDPISQGAPACRASAAAMRPDS
jgi:hypothetical protein